MQRNETKLLLSLISGILLTGLVHGQSLAPQSVNSAAESVTQSNGSLSYTLGELVVLSQTDSNRNTLGNGFIPSAVISTKVNAILEPDAELLNVKVYPNPASDLVFVDILSSKIKWINIDVVDIQGKLVSTQKNAGIVNQIGINAAQWQTGTYFLHFKTTENQIVGTYKLIKQ